MYMYIHTHSCTYTRAHTHTHTHTQSITVPLQGFLNALVYGWTREDFLHVIVRNRSDTLFSVDSVGGGNQVNSPLAESMNNEDERSEVFTSKADLDSSLDEQDGFDRSPLYTLTEDTEPEPDDDTDT